MEAKLEGSPLGDLNLAFCKREQCVWVQPAEGSRLSHTQCFMPWWLSLSFIHLSNTRMYLHNTRIIIRLRFCFSF